MSLFDLSNCSFSYGEKPALDNVSCSFTRGKFHGLIGPNGSGKTTLLDLLAGVISPKSGTVMYQDKTLQSFGIDELACHISLVPQDVNLHYDFTVEQVVTLGRHPHIPRFSNPSNNDLEIVEENLKLLDIWQMRKQRANKLSGGEKQRVAVARALTQTTPVLLLDEATSNLDIHHTIDIMNILRNKVAQENLTVIASMHDLNLASAFSDEVLTLQDGAVFTTGRTKEVITEGNIKQLFKVDTSIAVGLQSSAHNTVVIDYFPDKNR